MQVIEYNVPSSFADGEWIYVRGKLPNIDIGKAPILFTHGATFSPSSGYDLPLPWRGERKSMMDILVEYGYPCFFLDFRGAVGRSYIPEFMKTECPPELYNVALYATHDHATQDIHDAAKWIISLGYNKIHGKSWSGGTTSLYNCAVRYPELFETICLYGQKWKKLHKGSFYEHHQPLNIPGQYERRYKGIPENKKDLIIPKIYYDIWLQEAIHLSNTYNEYIPRSIIIEMNEGWYKGKNLYESESIDMPILILGSQYDYLTPKRMQFEAYDYIKSPRKDIYIIPNSTHYCPVEPMRGEMIDILLNFYDS